MTLNDASINQLCPVCGSAEHVRSKTVLIDAAWVPEPGKDTRDANFASLRTDDVKPEYQSSAPLQQFLDGFYCDTCGLGFVPDHYEVEGARFYYFRYRKVGPKAG